VTPVGVRSIGPYPGKCLAHLVDVTRHGNRTRRTFTQYPITVARPPEGSVSELVSCGSCDRAIVCTVHSAAETRRRRRTWLILLAVVVAVFAVDFVPRMADLWHMPDPLAAVIWIVAPLVSLGSIGMYREEDGVTIFLVRADGTPFPAPYNGIHRLRWP